MAQPHTIDNTEKQPIGKAGRSSQDGGDYVSLSVLAASRCGCFPKLSRYRAWVFTYTLAAAGSYALPVIAA